MADLPSIQISFARDPADFDARAPPAVAARYFYTSPLAIDDPLSPIPPPNQTAGAAVASAYYKTQQPRPFSQFDNDALEREWGSLRKRKREREAEAANRREAGKRGSVESEETTTVGQRARGGSGGGKATVQPLKIPGGVAGASGKRLRADSQAAAVGGETPTGSVASGSSWEPGSTAAAAGGESSLTKTPFIRAPSRGSERTASRSTSARPSARPLDSYNWGEDTFATDTTLESPSRNLSKSRPEVISEHDAADQTQLQVEVKPELGSQVPVGVSRLHSVAFPEMQMVPIYWLPVNDIAPVIRATWFYHDTMLPVEADIANLLEAGYTSLGAWTDTWKDEVNSAVEHGALGEMKLVHKLWPDKSEIVVPVRPESGGAEMMMQTGGTVESAADDPEKDRRDVLVAVEGMLDRAAGPDGPDNKATGSAPFGKDGVARQYKTAGVIYANDKDAYILKPSQLPSKYYGRRPLANSIRRGRPIGIKVVRGFNKRLWQKLHPEGAKSVKVQRASEGVSSAEAGAPQGARQEVDETLAESERPEVTDLLLVIHGIGQKLSERVESYHFTHAINTFRREVNVELGNDTVKAALRPNMGGIMVLPVNWRLTLSFEDGGYRDDDNGPPANEYSLSDITPNTLPSVRNIVSDVMLDIPYYLTSGYHDKMVSAVIRDANRIYQLWCINNPGFSRHGRVHLIAHSLGSVMAVDILSSQPTEVSTTLNKDVASLSPDELPQKHFAFNVHNLYLAGSPAGFFLLLKRVGLRPRRGRGKAGSEEYADEGDALPGVVGEAGEYGCLPVANLYNVVNPYDPVAYCLNAAIDADYARTLRQAWIPSATRGWLSFPSLRGSLLSGPASKPADGKPATQSTGSASAAQMAKPTNAGPSLLDALTGTRLPSTVELETHNFTREEIAERKVYLLNDNGQIDYFLRYGGGPLEIQYLTMLGAHSSYWLSQDFIRLVVTEMGRRDGRDGCLEVMRAVKKKKTVV